MGGRYRTMMTFLEFYQMREGRAGLQASTDEIELIPSRRGFDYPFTVGKDNFVAKFTGPRHEYQRLEGEVKMKKVDNIWKIDLEGPKGYELTGDSDNPNAVYNQLMLASRKMVEQVNPDAIEFSGASADQNVMYDTFYRRYLSKAFTRINNFLYVRNDIVQSWNLAPEAAAGIKSISDAWDARVAEQKGKRREARAMRRAAPKPPAAIPQPEPQPQIEPQIVPAAPEPRQVPAGKPKKIFAWS
jgi:hypothetical protein